MTLPLREKRKQETARHIQITTLELATQKGLENVTTEEIASASGVSVRTFFNYYPNKEAAAVGRPPKLTEEQKTALRTGTAPIGVEIKQLLDQRIANLSAQENVIRMLGGIFKSNEKTRGILEGFLAEERDEMAEALRDRVGNPQTATAIAIHFSSAVGGAIMLWEQADDLTLRAALDAVWQGMIEASQLLAASVDK